MGDALQVVGRRASSTAEAFTIIHKEKGDMDSGWKEPEGSGLRSQSITDIAVK
jgi:hypothetical protein